MSDGLMDRCDCLYGECLIKMDHILPRLRGPILSMKGAQWMGEIPFTISYLYAHRKFD